MTYRELLRKKLLEDIYDKMTDEDKRLFVQLTMQDKSHDEILKALQMQDAKIDRLSKSNNWLANFSSNIACNAVWDGLLYLGKALFKKL